MSANKHTPWITKRSLINLFAFAALLALAGVFSVYAQDATPAATEAAHGGTLRVATNAPQNLDPALGSNDPETLFNHLIYDYLIDIQPDNSIAPNLATAWTTSDDGLTYTFTLQNGVTFQDGAPFSSADVVFTFNRLNEVSSPAINLLGKYDVSAPDANTVVFKLPAPNADFLFGIGSRFAFILKDGTKSPDVVGEGDTALANFNGTGPFKLQSYSPEDRAVFVRNPNYWKPGQPYLDEVDQIFIDDPVAQIDALKGGTVDFIFKVAVDQISTLESDSTLKVYTRPSSQHPVIRLRTDEGPGKDPNVRQAFKLATDRDALNQLLLDGKGIVGNNDPISPVYAQYFDSKIDNPKYDPAAAKALLAKAGYADGLKLTLYTPDSLGYSNLATALQQQWAEAGINVDIVVRPENVYYSTDEWTTVDLGITGYGARPTPQQFLAEAYASTGVYNETHWSDPDLDKLIVQAATTADTTQRAAIYAQISQIFADRGPIIIPWFAPIVGVARSTVSGLDIAQFPGSTDLRTVSISS